MVLSRLVYRKGVDLAALVIPAVCAQCPNVQFVVGENSTQCMFPVGLNCSSLGGDGDRRIVLEEMREKHQVRYCFYG